jgi:hypothetical protein
MAEACASLTLFGKGSRRKRKQRDVEVDEKLLKCEKNGHNQDISADSDRRQSGSQCSTSPHPFQALGLSEHLEGVCASLGILHPTPVQVCWPCVHCMSVIFCMRSGRLESVKSFYLRH